MAHEVSVTTLERQPFIGITETTTMQKIGETLGAMYGELVAYIERAGLEPAAAPFARYHRMEQDGTVELEGGVALTSAAEGSGRIHSGELPAGEAAMLTHTGSYDALGDAVLALARWLDTNGRTASGPHWEHYVDDPETTGPEDLRTILYWPLA
jgi:effector-binding domain-containing protein